MPRLSIIIPVLGEPRQFEDTLVSVLENLPADCQVVVALNRAYDDPYQLAGEVQFVESPAATSLAGLLNAALAACRAPIVHVVGCGVEVSAGWAEAALACFAEPSVAAVAALVLRRNEPERIHSAGVLYSAGSVCRQSHRKLLSKQRYFRAPLAADLIAAFFRRSALAAVGGFSERTGDEFTGLELAVQLHLLGFRCDLATDCVVTVAEAAHVPANPLVRGWRAERFFWRWAPTQGWLKSLSLHALQLAGTLAASVIRPSNLIELFGRGLALLTAPTMASHWRRLSSPANADIARDEPHGSPRDRREAA